MVRNTAENKHNHFPHLYPGRRTAGGAFSRQLEQGELELGKTSALSALKKQLGQRRTFVLAGKTTRDRLTEEKSSCVQQREDGEGRGIGSECIVLPIDEANKCHRARDRGRRAWLVLGNHVGWVGGGESA